MNFDGRIGKIVVAGKGNGRGDASGTTGECRACPAFINRQFEGLGGYGAYELDIAAIRKKWVIGEKFAGCFKRIRRRILNFENRVGIADIHALTVPNMAGLIEAAGLGELSFRHFDLKDSGKIGIRALNDLETAEGIDAQRNIGSPEQIICDAANAIAAHGCDGTVGIDDMHGGIDIIGMRIFEGLRDDKYAIGTDAVMPVADLAGIGDAIAEQFRLFSGIDDDEIIAGGFVFGEFHGHVFELEVGSWGISNQGMLQRRVGRTAVQMINGLMHNENQTRPGRASHSHK